MNAKTLRTICGKVHEVTLEQAKSHDARFKALLFSLCGSKQGQFYPSRRITTLLGDETKNLESLLEYALAENLFGDFDLATLVSDVVHQYEAVVDTNAKAEEVQHFRELFTAVLCIFDHRISSGLYAKAK